MAQSIALAKSATPTSAKSPRQRKGSAKGSDAEEKVSGLEGVRCPARSSLGSNLVREFL